MAAAVGPATKPQAQADTATATGSGWRVFVGQLPFYLENDKIIRKHFEKCKVKAVRMLSDKKTKKFRGIAFLELEDKESLVQALTLHQSRLGHKKINVEISSGGGGNSAKRKQKNKAGRERIDKQLEAKRERQRTKKQVCASELTRGVSLIATYAILMLVLVFVQRRKMEGDDTNHVPLGTRRNASVLS